MDDTFGRTSRTPFAFYDPDTRCLRTLQATFHLGLPTSSLTLPKQGSMRNGQLFAHPTSAHRTVVSGSSSSPLIGTPTAGLGMGGGRRSHTYDPTSTSQRQPNPRELIDPLPTPLARTGERGRDIVWAREHPDGSPRTDSLETAMALLPTPLVRNNENRQSDGYGPNPGEALLATPRATRGGSSTENHYALTGATTPQPSNGGRPSWDGQHQTTLW